MGALSDDEKQELLRRGFIPWEVKQFDQATAGDTASGHVVPQDVAFSSEPFQDMIHSRESYIEMLKGYGWQPRQIISTIIRYYQLRGGRSPWDFLKIEYKPARTMTDFQWGRKAEARTRISRTFGKAYGRGMAPQKRPKFLPVRRRTPLQ